MGGSSKWLSWTEILAIPLFRTLALKPENRYPSVTTFLAELKLATQPEPSVSPIMIANGNVTTIHPALAAHAHITSLDAFFQYEQTENEAEVVPPDYFVAEPGNHAASSKEDQLASPTPQDPPHVGTPLAASTKPQTHGESTAIVRASLAWKWPAGVIGAALTLLVIALLLVYSFNSGVQPGVKHVPALATSPTRSNKATVSSLPIPPTAKPIATQTPTIQTPA